MKEYKNELGQLHRTDGPAVERSDGGKEWWINGLRHREDGPAVEWDDDYKEWWAGRLGRQHPDQLPYQ